MNGTACEHARYYTRKNLPLKKQPETHAAIVAKGEKHDVISSNVTSVINDGFSLTFRKIQTALCFDIDAEKTSSAFKDEAGRVVFERVQPVLAAIAPSLNSHLRFGIRSRGGRVLHLWISIAPFVVSKQTEPIHSLFTALQRSLCEAFNDKGIGADVGAVGLLKDFATWQEPSTVLFHNPEASRGLERSREARIQGRDDSKPLLSIGLRETRAWLESRRLYSDLRAERGCARLFLHLLDHSWDDQCLSVNQLMTITGWSESFALRIAKGRIVLPWLFVKPARGASVIALRVTKNMADIHTRALRLVSHSIAGVSIGHCAIGSLPAPETIEDGQRNTWIYRYALALAVCGVSRDRAETILTRIVSRIPGSDKSRNCKKSSLRSKLNFVYKLRIHTPRTAGHLPEWMRAEIDFSHVYAKQVATEKSASEQQNPTNKEGVPRSSSPAPDTIHHSLSMDSPEKPKNAPVAPPAPQAVKSIKLAVVMHGKRVGIFHENRLLMLLTNCRNYRRNAVISWLRSTEPALANAKPWHPQDSNPSMPGWISAMNDPGVIAIPAAVVCGRRPTKADKIAEWQESRHRCG